MLKRFLALICCALVAACSSLSQRGLDTHNQTVPVYNKKF